MEVSNTRETRAPQAVGRQALGAAETPVAPCSSCAARFCRPRSQHLYGLWEFKYTLEETIQLLKRFC